MAFPERLAPTAYAVQRLSEDTLQSVAGIGRLRSFDWRLGCLVKRLRGDFALQPIGQRSKSS